MRRIVSACLLWGVSLLTLAQSDPVVIGNRLSLESHILGETRNLLVYIPGELAGHPHTSARYQVLYLLDGEAHFHSVTGLVNHLSEAGGNSVIPPMIVVGITNTDRTRDMTPTYVREVMGDTTLSRTTGGLDNFLRFLEEELIPFIDEKYPTTSNRTFVGHSLGGLAGVYAMIMRPGLFQHTIAIDPSLWWDDEWIAQQADGILGSPSLAGHSLYLAAANTLPPGMDLPAALEDSTFFTMQVRSIMHFAEQVEQATDRKFHFDWRYFAEDNHLSIPLIATYEGLRYIFDGYQFPWSDYFMPGNSPGPEEMAGAIRKHFRQVSDTFGYEVLPPESTVNLLGYTFLSMRDFDKAEVLFAMNVANHPESANVFDSMGDYYMAKGLTDEGLEYYRKALSLGDNPMTRQKIEQITNEE